MSLNSLHLSPKRKKERKNSFWAVTVPYHNPMVYGLSTVYILVGGSTSLEHTLIKHSFKNDRKILKSLNIGTLPVFYVQSHRQKSATAWASPSKRLCVYELQVIYALIGNFGIFGSTIFSWATNKCISMCEKRTAILQYLIWIIYHSVFVNIGFKKFFSVHSTNTLFPSDNIIRVKWNTVLHQSFWFIFLLVHKYIAKDTKQIILLWNFNKWPEFSNGGKPLNWKRTYCKHSLAWCSLNCHSVVVRILKRVMLKR